MTNWAAEILGNTPPGQYAWTGPKFISMLASHASRYPAFKPERVAQMFLDAPMSLRAAYCYRDISSFTKRIHKARSMRSLARNEHL